MLFIIISKYILGSAGFATAIIIFLSMVAWIVPRPGLGTSGVPVAKDPFGFQKDFYWLYMFVKLDCFFFSLQSFWFVFDQLLGLYFGSPDDQLLGSQDFVCLVLLFSLDGFCKHLQSGCLLCLNIFPLLWSSLKPGVNSTLVHCNCSWL